MCAPAANLLHTRGCALQGQSSSAASRGEEGGDCSFPPEPCGPTIVSPHRSPNADFMRYVRTCKSPQSMMRDMSQSLHPPPQPRSRMYEVCLDMRKTMREGVKRTTYDPIDVSPHRSPNADIMRYVRTCISPNHERWKSIASPTAAHMQTSGGAFGRASVRQSTERWCEEHDSTIVSFTAAYMWTSRGVFGHHECVRE